VRLVPSDACEKRTGPKRRDKETAIKRAESDLAFSGIYIIGPRSGYPVCFGFSKQPDQAYRAKQQGYWDEQVVHAFVWTPGKPAAERIKRIMAERLANRRQFFNLEWYDLSVSEAIAHLEDIARQERVELFNDIEKMRRVEAYALRGIGRKMAAFGNAIRMKPRLIKG
jgi:hypothetical protein